jgi:hypothetical protein
MVAFEGEGEYIVRLGWGSGGMRAKDKRERKQEETEMSARQSPQP